ncbi:MAG: hypothetical protein IKJ99_01660 [Oscillospiraceae bacterium]|nr:hypothetical protein [Oscillospiraceae bacterium]
MEALFLKLVNMSITASYLVIAVLILRLLLRKAPRYIHVILWGIVALRLLLPFSIESVLSLIPNPEPLPQEFLYAATPQINSGIPVVNQVLNPVIADSLTPEGLTSANPTQILSFVFAWLWVIGMAVMALYAAISYWLVRRKVAASIPVGKNLRLCDSIDTPFILGIVKPKIYLPSSVDQKTADHVLAHEMAHLQRKDHWWKPLGFALLTVYWFNPVLWIAYILLCRDIEMACDEKVVQKLNPAEKKAYSTALLSCSVPRKMIAACPLAFGEVDVKNRIRSVLNYKKPAFWIVVVAIIICIVVAVCFLTNPKDSEDAELGSNNIIEDILNENGYKIQNCTPVDIGVSIRKSKLPDSIYSEEGHSFDANDVVIYTSDTTRFYLDNVRFANEGNDKLYFKFNCEYSYANSGTLTVPYSSIRDDGARYNVWVEEKSIYDTNLREYPNSVSIRGVDGISGANGGASFTVYIDTEVCKAAEGCLSFTINNFTDLTYERTYSDISELTASLSYKEIDRAQATLWTMPTQHVELSMDQVLSLVEILNHIPKEDFRRSDGVDHNITLMILCENKTIGLQSDGEQVWFLLDSETSNGIGGSWAVVNEDLNNFINDIYDTYYNRLVPGTYATSELVYWPLHSSWYWEEDPEYYYHVTKDVFISEHEDKTFDVDWGWETVAENAEELMWFFQWNEEWNEAPFKTLPEFDGSDKYQKIDQDHHLLLIDSNVYLVEGSDTGNAMTNVNAIYRLEPYTEVKVTYPDTANANQVSNLYSTISGMVYDARDGRDMLIRNALMTDRGVYNTDNIFHGESHQILAELYADEMLNSPPTGISVIDVFSVMLWAQLDENGDIKTTFELINATVTIDQYADGTLKLIGFQENGIGDPDKYDLTPLQQHCYDQAVKYWGLDTDRMVDNLLDTIGSSPAQYSNAAPYIEAHPDEYEKLINLGEYTLSYCFREFIGGKSSGIRGEIMAAACRDIGESLGEDISFEGQYVNGAGWFTAFQNHAKSLFDTRGMDALENTNRATWLLLNTLSQTPMLISNEGYGLEIIESEHHSNGISLVVDVKFPESVSILEGQDFDSIQSVQLTYTSQRGETTIPCSLNRTLSRDDASNSTRFHYIFNLQDKAPTDDNFTLSVTFKTVEEPLKLSWQADVDDAKTYHAKSGDSEVTLTISPYVINVVAWNLDYENVSALCSAITIWGKDGTIIPVNSSHGGSSGGGLIKLHITLPEPVDIDNIKTVKVGGLILKET